MLEYSVLLPQRDQAELTAAVIPAWCAALDRIGKPYELLVIDDASNLRQRQRLAELVADHPSVRLLVLDRPSGLSAALNAGLRVASGRVIVSWEVSQRYHPDQLPLLLARLHRADLVCGYVQRSTWLKWWRKFELLPRRVMLGPQHLDSDCRCWVALREAVVPVHLTRGQHRFLPWLVAMRGFRVGNAIVEQTPGPAAPRWGREWPHLFDLCCVWWLQQRWQSYCVQEYTSDDAARLKHSLLRADRPHRNRWTSQRTSQRSADGEER